MQYNYNTTYYLRSIPDIIYLPSEIGIEIAFYGRSNSGKSSAINTLTNQKNLALTSRSPGCTKMINFFEIQPGIRLVELPGYGYSKISKKVKFQWKNMVNYYLKKRKNLKGLVIMMDIRHPMKLDDQKIIKLAIYFNIPVIVLLSKSDKLTEKQCKEQLNQCNKMIVTFTDNIKIKSFSSIQKDGVSELRKILDDWIIKSYIDININKTI